MNMNTKQDLFWVMACLQAISFNEDLTAEEEEAIYNLYGHTKQELSDLMDTSAYDPEKMV